MTIEERRTYHRIYAQNHRKVWHDYYVAHRPEILAKAKDYYAKHHDEIAAKKAIQRPLHREEAKATSRTWRADHPARIKELTQQWDEKNSDKHQQSVHDWALRNPQKARAIMARHTAKHRTLGFIQLNVPFDGSEAHHIDLERVIHIPSELHQSVRHNIWTGRNMEKINALALAWLEQTKEWTMDNAGVPMTFAEKLDRLVVEEWKNEGRPMPWPEFKQAILQAAVADEKERQAYYRAMGASDPRAADDFEAVGAEVAGERNLP